MIFAQAASRSEAVQHGELILLVVALAIAFLYWMSLYTHPYRTCRKCKGNVRSDHWLFGGRGNAFTTCSSCGGTGRTLRAGARRGN